MVGETAKAVINQILWDPSWIIDNFKVEYTDNKGISERVNVRLIAIEDEFILLEDGRSIPLNKIMRIYDKDEIVWDKKMENPK